MSARTESGLNMLCWSGCTDSSYSYGSNSGGAFTTVIRAYAAESSTYAEVWNRIQSDTSLTARQRPQQTRFGNFDIDTLKVFR